MVLVTFFFHQTYAGMRKKKKMSKEKNARARCSRPPDRQMKHLPRVDCSHSLFFKIFCISKRCMIEFNSFQSPRKFDFSWYMTFLRGERTFSTMFNIANAFVLPRSIAKWEARKCFRFRIKNTSWFCQSKTSLLAAESTFGNFNRTHSGF